MAQSRLVARTVLCARGRTRLRIEPEFWEALAEICARERVRLNELVRRIERHGSEQARLASALRVYAVGYFRNAGTEDGHRRAGHGTTALNGASRTDIVSAGIKRTFRE